MQVLKTPTEVTSQEKTVGNAKDATAYIERFIKSKKDKLYSLDLSVQGGGNFRVVGYGEATLIKTSEFVVYVHGKNSECAFLDNFARAICKKYGESFFNEELLLSVVRHNSKLKKLRDTKMADVATVFSAVNNAKVSVLPPQREFVRMNNDMLKMFSRDCEEQIRCAALLAKLESENISPKEAVQKVLQISNTENLAKACSLFGFKVEGDICLSFLEKERRAKKELVELLTKLDEAPIGRKELEEYVKKIGKDVCELNLTRRVIRYSKEVAEDEMIIPRTKYLQSIQDEVLKEQMRKQLETDIAYTEKKRKALAHFEDALKMIKEMG